MTIKPAYLSSNDIRQAFLNYFHDKNHEIVHSSSLIPHNDPTLLFTNAGMVQFKDVFLGNETRAYQRAASAQRCVRAGGKHNDLERVGYTARHHTFFEMLGNFSFGDYFKLEAIQYAWDFLTKVLKLPEKKLWVTIFKDDKEAEEIWLKHIGIDPERFSRCDEHDNFWSMGQTGPCGPCTEIFYDHGSKIAGGPPGSPDADGDRYVEIWNLVFMQYNRNVDGILLPLPKPSVDTGMGLERIAAVMQGVSSNYETDLFKPLIQTIAGFAGVTDLKNPSLSVIADHIRSASFLITDSVFPSNEGRGYVLRRIIRRALRHGHKLGLTHPFFYRLAKPLSELMGKAYPELLTAIPTIERLLKQEEEQFGTTLSQGIKLFDEIIANLKSDIIPGEVIFKLYDTYGFPSDLTADIARERKLILDLEAFETEMHKQRDRSRQHSHFAAEQIVMQNQEMPTEFIGHKNLFQQNTLDQSNVIAIYKNGQFVNSLKSGEKASIVLDRTPFYAESGGQVGDQGILRKDNAFFKVLDTIKQGQTHLHLGKLEKGELLVGDIVSTEVDAQRRLKTVLNHTATHLLHMILRELLGEAATQKGSLVEPDRLRFDFTYPSPLSTELLQQIEKRVNEEIRANHEGLVRITTPAEAMAKGAIALFGEKYGSKVRVVNFGKSQELCGGTHADSTGQIGLFKITSESGVAAGIRRIEAVTGEGALTYLEKKEKEQSKKLLDKDQKLIELEKELTTAKHKLASFYAKELALSAKKIGSHHLLLSIVNDLEGKTLRQIVDQLKHQLQSAVILLATTKVNKVGLISGVTEDLTDRVSAKELLNIITKEVGGKAGGRADLAEGGGNKPEKLEKALQLIYTWVSDKLS